MVDWPNGFRCAISFSFDVDFDSAWRRRLIENKLPEDEPVVRSIGLYGAKRGLSRILGILNEEGIKATFFIPGIIAERFSDLLQAIKLAGHEIAHHGYDHISPQFLSEEEQKNEILRGLNSLQKVFGIRPVGYRSPGEGLGKQTLKTLAENGFIYDSTMMDDDLPYILEVDGKKLVEIPWKWVYDDYPFFVFNYYPPLPYKHSPPVDPQTVLQIWKSEFDAIYDEGLFMTIICHPHQTGQPSRARMLHEFIRYVKTKTDVWITTYKELAEFILKSNIREP